MPDQVRFTETMRGWLAPYAGQTHEAADAQGALEDRRSGASVADSYFILTVVTPDVVAMVADPDRRSPAFGCVVIPRIEPRPLRVVDGWLDLFVDAAPGVVQMRYGLKLSGETGRYYLRGVKEIVRQGWVPTVFRDTTTLFVDVFDGDEPAGTPRLRGVIRMGVGGVTAQGLTFRGEGGLLGLSAIARFARYYVGRVLTVYLGPRGKPLRT